MADVPSAMVVLAASEQQLALQLLGGHLIHAPHAGRFVIESERLERLIALSDLSHHGALSRLHRILERWGVMLALRERGIAHGDEVRVGDFGFEWLD